MSQLEGGRSQAAFIRSGGGTIQRQNLASLEVNPLRVAPPVSTSANQLEQLNQTISAAASTIEQGGRYADWLRRKREAEAERQRLAMQAQFDAADKAAEATSKLEMAQGRAFGDTLIEVTLDDIANDRIPRPPSWGEMSDTERVEYVKEAAIGRARGENPSMSSSFEDGVRSQMSGGRVFGAIRNRAAVVMSDMVTAQVASYSDAAIKMPTDALPDDYKQTYQELRDVISPEVVDDRTLKAKYFLPALEVAAENGDSLKFDRVRIAMGDGFEAQVHTAQQKLQRADKARIEMDLAKMIGNTNFPSRAIRNQVEYLSKTNRLTGDEFTKYMGQVEARDAAMERQSATKSLDDLEGLTRQQWMASAYLAFTNPELGVIEGVEDTITIEGPSSPEFSSFLTGKDQPAPNTYSRKVSMSKDDREKGAWAMVSAEAVQNNPGNPEAALADMLTYATRRNYIPSEWKSSLSAAYSGALTNFVGGKESPIPANIKEAVSLSDAMYNANPVYAASVMGDYYPTYKAIRSLRTVRGVGDDLQRAFSLLANAKQNGGGQGVVTQEMFDAAASSAGADDPRSRALLSERLETYQKSVGLPAESALELAASEFKEGAMDINGHKTYFIRKDALPFTEPAAMNDYFTTYAKQLEKDSVKLRNFVTGTMEAVNANNVVLNQDGNGFFRLTDTSGFLLFDADGSPLMFSPDEFRLKMRDAWVREINDRKNTPKTLIGLPGTTGYETSTTITY